MRTFIQYYFLTPFLLLLGPSELISQYFDSEYLNARIKDISFDPYSKLFFVEYDIVNANSSNLYLIEFEYVEFFNYNIVKPVKGSVSGDAGEYAIRGGEDKQFIWDFNVQPQSSLELGEFRIDVIQLETEVSTKLNRLYGKQNKIRIKLEQPNLKSKKMKRLTRKLEQINRKIKHPRND